MIAPVCKIASPDPVEKGMWRKLPGESSRDRRRNMRRAVPPTAVRHITFCGRLLDCSPDGIAVESTTGLRIGDSYRLEIENHLGIHTLEAAVRWCRLVEVRRGRVRGEFEPLFVTGLALASPLPSFLSTARDATGSEEAAMPGRSRGERPPGLPLSPPATIF